ncbi:hypothetical protein, partial [Streptomyces sp. NPDC056670]|uniref:hypothetical protein n=1 Tax=Streptomyces sp. NPDC056670 TaxID=3345904 RepID=UPI0036811856
MSTEDDQRARRTQVRAIIQKALVQSCAQQGGGQPDALIAADDIVDALGDLAPGFLDAMSAKTRTTYRLEYREPGSGTWKPGSRGRDLRVSWEDLSKA